MSAFRIELQAAGGWALHRQLARRAPPRDGLHGPEAPARRHRGEAAEEALSARAQSGSTRCARCGCVDTITPMLNATPTRVHPAAQAPGLAAVPMAELVQAQATTIVQLSEQGESLKHQLEWFKRQLFGRKSERFAPLPDAQQMHLGELMAPLTPEAAPEQDVPAHKRRKARSDFADDSASAPFFDETKVPVLTIEVPNPEAQGLAREQYEVIGEKTSHRLAQRPGSYVVLKYVRPVIKRLDTQTLHCPSAPVGLIAGSRG